MYLDTSPRRIHFLGKIDLFTINGTTQITWRHSDQDSQMGMSSKPIESHPPIRSSPDPQKKAVIDRNALYLLIYIYIAMNNLAQ